MKYDASQYDLGIRNNKSVYFFSSKLELLDDLPDNITKLANKVDDKRNPIKIMKENHPELTNELIKIHAIEMSNNFLLDKTPVIKIQYLLTEIKLRFLLSCIECVGIDIIDFLNLRFTLGINVMSGKSTHESTDGYIKLEEATNKLIDNTLPARVLKSENDKATIRFEKIYNNIALRIVSYKFNFLTTSSDYPVLELTAIPENFYLMSKFTSKNGSIKDTNISTYIPHLLGTSCKPKTVLMEKITNTDKLNSLITTNNNIINIIDYINEQYSFYTSKTIFNFDLGGNVMLCSCDNYTNKAYSALSNNIYYQHVAIVDDNIGFRFKNSGVKINANEPDFKTADPSTNFSPTVILMKDGVRNLALTQDSASLRISKKINSSMIRAIGVNEYVSNATTRIGITSTDISKTPTRINRKLTRKDPKLLGKIDYNYKVRMSKTMTLDVYNSDIRPFIIPGFVFKYYMGVTYFDAIEQDEFVVNDYRITIISDPSNDNLGSTSTIHTNLYKLSRPAEEGHAAAVADITENLKPPVSEKTQFNTSNTPGYENSDHIDTSNKSMFPDDYVPSEDKPAHGLSKASIAKLKMSSNNIKKVIVDMLYTAKNPFSITGTHRTVAQERIYIRKGTSKTGLSKHLTYPTIAIDVNSYDENGKFILYRQSLHEKSIWSQFITDIKSSAATVNVDIRQGYTWNDWPHFEENIPSNTIKWPADVLQLEDDRKNGRI